MTKPLKVAIGTDHAGRPLRETVADAIVAAGHTPIHVGPQEGAAIDYPIVAEAVADALTTAKAQRGIVVCGSGAGVTVAANKIPGIRSALAHETYTAAQMVEHDHVNVLAMGARVIGADVASSVVTAFIGAEFSGVERHARRLSEVLTIERKQIMNAPQQLHDTGQRLWLDNITKELLSSGTLSHYINDLSITGVTSNPTILEKAISSGGDYDAAISEEISNGSSSPEDIVYSVALADLVAAADLLRPIFDASRGTDGYVSVEVPPGLADDTEESVAAGRRLFALADRPNVMIKVPGTAAGLPAIEELTAAGIPVNVTLLFSPEHYMAAVDAYMKGLERRVAKDEPVVIGSVASVFVSRWDAAIDPDVPDQLQGKAALAVMQQIYAEYQKVLESDRWKALEAKGAVAQKVLFASTGTKNPSLADTYYLGRLAAPGTVDTIPEATLLAFADHGVVCDLLEPDAAGAAEVLAQVTSQGVDIDALAARLQSDGAKSFVASWNDLLACVDQKVEVLKSA